MTEIENEVGNTEFAFLYCSNCNKLWGTAEPGPTKYGIVLEANKEYITINCAFCSLDDTYSLKEVEDFKRQINFSSLRTNTNEAAINIQFSLDQFYKRLQRLWAEMGLQVYPSYAGEVFACA